MFRFDTIDVFVACAAQRSLGQNPGIRRRIVSDDQQVFGIRHNTDHNHSAKEKVVPPPMLG